MRKQDYERITVMPSDGREWKEQKVCGKYSLGEWTGEGILGHRQAELHSKGAAVVSLVSDADTSVWHECVGVAKYMLSIIN